MAKATTATKKKVYSSSPTGSTKRQQRIILYVEHEGDFSIKKETRGGSYYAGYTSTDDLAEFLHAAFAGRANIKDFSGLMLNWKIMAEDITAEQLDGAIKEDQ